MRRGVGRVESMKVLEDCECDLEVDSGLDWEPVEVAEYWEMCSDL